MGRYMELSIPLVHTLVLGYHDVATPPTLGKLPKRGIFGYHTSPTHIMYLATTHSIIPIGNHLPYLGKLPPRGTLM